MTPSISFSWLDLTTTIPNKRLKIEHLSNSELILVCQQGKQPDRVAFAELLRRHQSYVDKILYNLASDWTDRADLAQEIWIKVYKYLKRLHEPNKFKAWLSRIATNVFYDQLRKRKKEKNTYSLDAFFLTDEGDISLDLPSNEPLPQDRLNTNEFYDFLQMAISTLPESFRVTILLREIQELNYEEIADITGVSIGTVKSRIARARQRLQVILKPYLERNT